MLPDQLAAAAHTAVGAEQSGIPELPDDLIGKLPGDLLFLAKRLHRMDLPVLHRADQADRIINFPGDDHGEL